MSSIKKEQKIKILPSTLEGSLEIISSKSYLHRILICAALSKKETLIKISGQISDDILATIDCLNCLGAKVAFKKGLISVLPIIKKRNNVTLNVRESGSTLRFLVPVVISLGTSATFIGGEALSKRPIGELIQRFEAKGVEFSSKKLPFKVKGNIDNSIFEISSDITSQYVTGLLLASPLNREDTIINITSEIESSEYIEMTLDVMKKFNIDVKRVKNSLFIKKDQEYLSKGEIKCEGDYSQAAFFFVAAALSKGEIKVNGLLKNSKQGDKAILNILKEFGANVEYKRTYNSVLKNNKREITVDASQIPDLVPIVSILSCAASGVSRIANVKRLEYKESNRILSTIDMINSLGAKAIYEDNSIIIFSKGYLDGGSVKSYNDHRIIFSAAIASLISKHPIIIDDISSHTKSYPGFFEVFKKLKGEFDYV